MCWPPFMSNVRFSFRKIHWLVCLVLMYLYDYYWSPCLGSAPAFIARPVINSLASHSPCADFFGSVASSVGCDVGSVDPHYAGKENQKSSALHVHWVLFLQCVSLFSSMADTQPNLPSNQHTIQPTTPTTPHENIAHHSARHVTTTHDPPTQYNTPQPITHYSRPQRSTTHHTTPHHMTRGHST